MRIQWLSVQNWRQFEGDPVKIEFAQDPSHNVTVVHGANGAGKTALLNALTWAFHGKFTDALAMPHHLVNRRAIANAHPGERVDAVVTVRFEHAERVYQLKRTAPVIRGQTPSEWSELDPTISMLSSGTDGKWMPIKPAEIPDVIGRILPEQLLPYFFFDGERIGQLQRPDKRSEITSAVTMLIGELVLNRSIGDLESIEKRLTKEMQKSLLDDAVASALVAQADDLTAKMEAAQCRTGVLADNLAGLIKRKQAIGQELRTLEGVKHLQEQRDQFDSERANLQKNMEANLDSVAGALSSEGYQVYMKAATETFLSKVEDLRTKGELPTALKIPFLKKLLDQGRCICGRDLVEGEQAYSEIMRWMEYAGLSEIEEIAIRMEGEIQRMDRDIPLLYQRVDLEKTRYDGNKQRLAQVEKSLDGIREQLKGSPTEQPKALENALAQTEQDIETVRAEQVENRHHIQLLSEELRKKHQAIDEREVKTREQEIARARVNTCREVLRILTEVRDRQRRHFRADLSDRINRIFSDISIKPYTAVLNEDYTLSLYEVPGGPPIPASTGEMQVLSLAFIGGVIDQARVVSARQDRLPGPDSSTFPLVMDSPFGSLDPHHRGRVADNMPKLANQVLILSTRSQWEADVEEALGQRIGKEYVLSYFSPKSEVPEDSIVRNGRVYGLVRRSGDEFERTEILEVLR